MVSGFGTALGAKAPSRVYAPALVLPLTLTLRVPRPRVPALLTSAAEPDVIDSTCVKLRVVSGTAVIVRELITVLLEGAAVVDAAVAGDRLGGFALFERGVEDRRFREIDGKRGAGERS